MSIQSSDILNAAKLCLEMNSEAGFRSCTSRAYYSMYHESLDALQCVPNYTSNHHSNLIGYMTTPAETKTEPYDSRVVKVLGYNLKQMRDARNEADYRISELTVSRSMAEASLESAELYFSKWNDLRAAKAS
ncbi:hypothetical protein [Enterobacter asburiae]|uniref:hypothetical protein n=1 Tax=Enterobacter asburiae TaxID=61645 RepID=UPI0020000663|nr:hypothetical protein [Enterobacter asburiae]MCK2177298.1 hypothetical protein [Enterobacter asburiae]